MKVAQILYHTCPLASEEGKESGGANVYVLKLSEELVKKGIQVDMFTRSEDPNVPHEIKINSNLRLIHLKAGPEKTLPKEKLINYIPEFVENLSNFVGTGLDLSLPQKKAYDILDCHYFMSGIAAMSFRACPPLEGKQESLKLDPRFRGDDNRLKTIITFHTLGLIKNLVARNPSEIADSTRINAEKELVEKFDAVIAPSKNEREFLHYLYNANPKKIHIVSPGFDPEIFKPIDKLEAKKRIHACQDHKIVLFVGRIEPLKGIDSLLYATKIAFEKYQTKFCVFVIGGEKQEKGEISSVLNNGTMEQLNNLRHELNLQSSVKFIKQVSQHELANYYNAADCVVMPSHYESFGLTALEAMACETPVVITDTAGISGILEKNHKNGVISAGNPLLLAEKIHQIISNESFHDKISSEIKKTIENLTWEKTAKEIVKIYNLLCSQPKLSS